MKVALITTVDHNIGDDFVRDGIVYLLRQVIGPFEPLLIHKHFPVSVRDGWEKCHTHPLVRALCRVPGIGPVRLSRLLDGRSLQAVHDKVLRCDLLVQCGAPVYWLTDRGKAEDCEWYGPLITRRWMHMAPRPPLLNLGAGTCQAYHSDASEYAGATTTLNFVREFGTQCALTTVRDRLSVEVLRHAGTSAPRLPCPSIFARYAHEIEPAAPGCIALNYMVGGGHYDFTGTIDRGRWQKVFSELVAHVRRRGDVVIVCHNLKEREEASRLWPDVPRFHAKSAAEYLRFYARVKWGIFNRVHAAFALASFGRPVVVVGADSRARMAEEIGLRDYYVSDVTAEFLFGEVERLENVSTSFGAEMTATTEVARASYLELLRNVLLPKA